MICSAHYEERVAVDMSLKPRGSIVILHEDNGMAGIKRLLISVTAS